MTLVEGLADEGFDEGLAADVELLGGGVELFEHRTGEVHVDALDDFLREAFLRACPWPIFSC